MARIATPHKMDTIARTIAPRDDFGTSLLIHCLASDWITFYHASHLRTPSQRFRRAYAPTAHRAAQRRSEERLARRMRSIAAPDRRMRSIAAPDRRMRSIAAPDRRMRSIAAPNITNVRARRRRDLRDRTCWQSAQNVRLHPLFCRSQIL